MGPSPADGSYLPWATEVSSFRCPSDPGEGLPSLGRTNYAACTGDSSFRCNESRFRHDTGANSIWKIETNESVRSRACDRGCFSFREKLGFRDIRDGTANTIAVGEINTDLGDKDVTTSVKGGLTAAANYWFSSTTTAQAQGGAWDNPASETTLSPQIDPTRPRFWANETSFVGTSERRGYRWADALARFTQMHTIIPPNTPVRNNGSQAICPPSSRHQGGCHILMADGAVKFVTDSIDAGNSSAPMIYLGQPVTTSAPGSASPYGLWGALGSRGAREVIDEEF